MELDDAYANAPYIENAADYPPRWASMAAAFRQNLGDRSITDLRYGASEREVFDMFLPTQTAIGTVIFIHGGYWRQFDKSFWSHLAAGAIDRGWSVAMPSYTLCPDNSISGITRQIAAVVAEIAGRVDGHLTLSGHSAGGHLAARMLAPDILDRATRHRIKHVVPISPLSDLLPLLKTTMNQDFRLDANEARAESPIHQPKPSNPVTVWVGAEERPAFLKQARWLAEAWAVECHVEHGVNHFNVIDALKDPQSALNGLLTPD